MALLLSAVWLYVLQYFVTVGIIFNPIFLFFLSLFFCSLYDSITNLNNRVKSGRVTGISVQSQSVGSYTVTHNLGRPNVPVATIYLGNSSSPAWGNTQINVYDVTNNEFKVKIHNNTSSSASVGFYWVVVATD